MTLVELMIVLAILAVLATLAWPTYRDSVLRSRRADGMAALTRIMQSQERWRANHPAYQATLSDLPGAQRMVSDDGHYALSLDGVTATTYTARATVASTSPQTADSRCQVLEVEMNGGNITYRSQASGNAANAAPDPCWAR